MHDERGSLGIIIVAVVLALGFGLLTYALLSATPKTITVDNGGTGTVNTISVTGQAQFDVDPDQAEMYIRVETTKPTARNAQDANTQIMNQVKNALERAGVDEDDMETINYNMYPKQEWNQTSQRYEDHGYTVQHTLKLTTTKLEEVGRYLEVAVDNGANGLDNVQFTLSDQKQEDVNQQALSQAAGNAKDKAESIASGIGVRLGGISSVSESNVNYGWPYPMYARAETAAYDSAAGKAAPELSPQSVTVSATISVAYKIE